MNAFGGSGKGVVNNPFGLGMLARLRARLPDEPMPATPPPPPPPNVVPLWRPPPQSAYGGRMGPPTAPPTAPPLPGLPAPARTRPLGKAPIVGRDLPLEELVKIQRAAESTNNYTALNKEKPGNTASGAYQYTDRTWNNYGGYPKALLAPKAVQDRRFMEDIQARVKRYDGDVFKAAAEHYLPKYAGSPDTWDKPQRIGNQTVKPVAWYLKERVFRGTPFEEQVDAYIAAHKQ